MSYQFAGFFAKPTMPAPAALPSEAVWRVIESPFTGIGVRLPSLLDKTLSPSDVMTLADELGLNDAEDWLYITYDTWGGKIDYVYGLGRRNAEPFGPMEESSFSRVEKVYIALMEAFGVVEENALHFAPFQRGYWGEP